MMLQYAVAKVNGSFFLLFFSFSARPLLEPNTPPPQKSEHNGLRDMNEEVVFNQAVLLSLSTLDERPK